jgi:uncharacterized protein (TIGR03437 family)
MPGGLSQASSGIVIGDFDADGHPDVAAGFRAASATEPGGVSVLKGNGDGTFETAVNYGIGNFSTLSIVAGDFNNDGKLDIAAAGAGANFDYSSPGTLAILRGKGDGTFLTATLTSVGSPAGTPIALASADLNGDGNLDLVASVDDSNLHDTIVVLLGNGDGTFIQLAPITTPASGIALAIMDLNGDGIPDLIVGDCCGLSEAVFLLGNGDGTFLAPEQFNSGASTIAFAVADWNADGRAGLAVAQLGGTANGQATFQQGGTVMAMGSSLKGPIPAVKAVVNAASFAPGGVVPGAIATLFGTNLTSASGINLTPSLPLPNAFLTDTLLVNGEPAALFAIDNVNGQQQVNFQVPWETADGVNANVAVVNNGISSATVSVPVLTAQPGIFYYTADGKKFGAILHADFALANSANPAKSGEAVLIYCTGLGAVSSPPADGAAGSGEKTIATPAVTIGGANATVSFSGLAPGFVGLYQINAEVPAGLASGNQAVVVKAGGVSSNAVLLPVQ